MKPVLLSMAILSFSVMVIAQTDFHQEEFQFSYLPKKNGGQFLYNGRAHSFTVDIVSDNINTTEYPNYIKVNNHILQSSVVPLPVTHPDLKRLTMAEQKDALTGYMDYELDYFKNHLHLNFRNLKKEWMTINSRLWLIWSFNIPAEKEVADTVQQVVAQIYSSTICFNQVLDLNMPLFQDEHYEKTRKRVIQYMSTVKTFNKRQY